MRFHKPMLPRIAQPQAFFILSVLSLLLVNCCGIQIPVEIHDETLTLIKGTLGDETTYPDFAVQEHFLSSGQIDQTYIEFAPSLHGSVVMSAQAFEDLNSWVAKLCSNTPCNEQILEAWDDIYFRTHIARGSK